MPLPFPTRRCSDREQPKSQLYQDMLPVLNSRRVELLDVSGLAVQIANLERRTARGGRDSIDHPPNGHDDLANAVAGLIGLCVRPIEAPVAAFGRSEEHTAELQSIMRISYAV